MPAPNPPTLIPDVSDKASPLDAVAHYLKYSGGDGVNALLDILITELEVAAEAVDAAAGLLVVRQRTYRAFKDAAMYKSVHAFRQKEEAGLERAVRRCLTDNLLFGLGGRELVNRIVALWVQVARRNVGTDERNTSGAKAFGVFYSIAHPFQQYQQGNTELMAVMLSGLARQAALMRDLVNPVVRASMSFPKLTAAI